jgi:hypothetical protein
LCCDATVILHVLANSSTRNLSPIIALHPSKTVHGATHRADRASASLAVPVLSCS